MSDFLVACCLDCGFPSVISDEGVVSTDDGGRPEEFIKVRQNVECDATSTSCR